MSMTKADETQLLAGINRILAEAEASQETAQVVIIHKKGPGPGPRSGKGPGPGPRSGKGPTEALRWQYSCPYCSAHGEYLPLDHDAKCPYA